MKFNSVNSTKISYYYYFVAKLGSYGLKKKLIHDNILSIKDNK